MAYCILCLENALKATSYQPEDWQFVLEKLWLFTNIEYVDEWLYIISELMPDSIMDDPFEAYADSCISYEQYNQIKKVYKGTPAFIYDIMECVFGCGRRHMYSVVTPKSPETYVILKSLRKIMRKHQIELPNEDLLKKYHIKEHQGWGITFERKDLFKVDVK